MVFEAESDRIPFIKEAAGAVIAFVFKGIKGTSYKKTPK